MDQFYFAPLQSYTDFIYRYSFNKKITVLDKLFIPFIRIEKSCIRKSYENELRNLKLPNAVPQVLVNNINDLRELTDLIISNNYSELNINLGCPYPMVAKNNLGSGLIKDYKSIDNMLDFLFREYNIKISVKTRLGYENKHEIKSLIPILNHYPLEEIIIHPRIGTDLYKGQIDYDHFNNLQSTIKHKLVYNGDINTREDFFKLKNRYPEVQHWMLGRGILTNIFLIDQLKGITVDQNRKRDFYDEIYYQISKFYTLENTMLQKLKEFWMYFSLNFNESSKIWKKIKKTKNLNEYTEIVNELMFD